MWPQTIPGKSRIIAVMKEKHISANDTYASVQFRVLRVTPMS